MKIISVFILCYLIVMTIYSQDQSKQMERIESLVNMVESGNGITKIISCDTTPIYNKSYSSIYCHHLYTSQNKLVKAAFQIVTSPVPNEPLREGMVFRYQEFYFHNDSLIKAVRKDSINAPVILDQFYFTEKNLSELDLLKLKDPKKYKLVIAFTKYGENFLRLFRENRLD